jgi:DNA-binding transcriptional LysR family regulator
MEIRELRSLLHLSESGSLRETAAALHLSPAAVHKQLRALGSELGFLLYEKVGQRLKLTQGAEFVVPYLRSVLAQHDAAVAAAGEWKGLRRGLVRIGAGPTIASYLLPPLLKRFRRHRAGVELVVDTGNSGALLAGLSRGDLDMALLVAPPGADDPDVKVNLDWEFEIVLVANLRQAPRRCSIRDLSGLPFILFKKGSRIEEFIDRYFAATGFQPRVVMRLDNADAIKAMVRAGLGISMLPYWTVAADVNRKSLHLVHQDEKALVSRILLVSRKTGYVSQPAEAFIQLAQSFDFPKLRMHHRRQ